MNVLHPQFGRIARLLGPEWWVGAVFDVSMVERAWRREAKRRGLR
jgi:hypothetical protein